MRPGKLPRNLIHKLDNLLSERETATGTESVFLDSPFLNPGTSQRFYRIIRLQ